MFKYCFEAAKPIRRFQVRTQLEAVNKYLNYRDENKIGIIVKSWSKVILFSSGPNCLL